MTKCWVLRVGGVEWGRGTISVWRALFEKRNKLLVWSQPTKWLLLVPGQPTPLARRRCFIQKLFALCSSDLFCSCRQRALAPFACFTTLLRFVWRNVRIVPGWMRCVDHASVFNSFFHNQAGFSFSENNTSTKGLLEWLYLKHPTIILMLGCFIFLHSLIFSGLQKLE